MKGMLSHDYRVRAQDIHWFVGGLDAPTRRPLLPHAAGIVQDSKTSNRVGFCGFGSSYGERIKLVDWK